MLGNWWHKKEAPLLGLGGLWGGTFSSLSGAAAEEAGLATWSFPGPTPSVTNGKYTFYTFTSSTNFSLPTAAPEVAFDDDGVPGNYISAVLVGGGGGGGGHHGAGGGGGGTVHATGPQGQGVIDMKPGGGGASIPIKVGDGGFQVGNSNATHPGCPGQRSRIGKDSDAFCVIALGGGGGGSHQQPAYHGTNSPNVPNISNWRTNDTGPTAWPGGSYACNQKWWHPSVPGTEFTPSPGAGSNGGGLGPRSGGCGGGGTWSFAWNPGPWPGDYDGDAPNENHPNGWIGGGKGVAHQNCPDLPEISGNPQYGFGNIGGNGGPQHGSGGGGTQNAANSGDKDGGSARPVPQAFYGPGHPHYPSPRSYGAGGAGEDNGQGQGSGGGANPGTGGPGSINATGYGTGGGGRRVFNGVSGSGSAGIVIIKVRTSE